MKRSLKLLAAAAVAAVGLGLAACSAGGAGSTGTPTSTNAGYVPVTVGVGADAGYAPFFVADQQGLFKAAGLDVTLTQFATGGDALNALSAGQVQMTQSSPATITATMANNINVTAFVSDVDIAPGSKVVLRNGISSAKDVKNFGYVAGLSQFMAYQWFDANNIDPSTINWVSGGAADMPALLQRGDIDGFFLWDPWPGNATSAGTGTVVTSADKIPALVPTMVNWVATTHTWFDQNQATAKAITAVLGQAIDMINADPQMAANAVSTAVAIKPDAALATIKTYQWALGPITGDIVSATQKIGDFFVSTGAIKQAPDVASNLITNWSW